MGFVGSHLAEAFLLRGDSVCVIDDLSTGRRDNVAHLDGYRGYRPVVADVRSPTSLAELGSGPDLVVHLAATVGVRRVVEKPIETIENNVAGTEAVLSAARGRGTKVLIASTSEVYGRATKIPFAEDDDVVLGPSSHPRWGYAVSKLVDELLAFGYLREWGLPVVIARLFSVVGPRQSDQYVLPRFARSALAGEVLEIHGDGTQTRCFTHIDDVVDALVSICDCEAAVGQVLNVGAAEEVTILELARRVLHAVGVGGVDERCRVVPYAVAYGQDVDDMARRVPDNSKLTALTGWRPRLGLDQMIADVLNDQRVRLAAAERVGVARPEPPHNSATA
jgi:UDP-glucose 4-epimerase